MHHPDKSLVIRVAFLVESSIGIEYLRLISSFLGKAKLYQILSNLSSTDLLKKTNSYEEICLRTVLFLLFCYAMAYC